MARALDKTELAVHIAELVKALRQMEAGLTPQYWNEIPTHFCPICMTFLTRDKCWCDIDSDRF